MSVYLERVPAGTSPGALWVRICAGDELVDQHPLDDAALTEALALNDVDVAMAAADRHGEARVYIYDGDSGECVKTIIVGGP